MAKAIYTPDQKRCIETLDRPLQISAGAGSGKTFTLQQRIAYALDPESQSGVEDISQIMAITYTTKAAEELKSRIRVILAQMGRGHEVYKVDEAWISTIHSMCLRILKEQAFSDDLGQNLAIATEADSQAIAQEAFSQLLATQESDYLEGKLDRDTYDRFLDMLDIYGVLPSRSCSLFNMISEIKSAAYKNPAGFEGVMIAGQPAKPSYLAVSLLGAYESYLDADPTDKMRAPAEASCELLQQFLSRPTQEQNWDNFQSLLNGLSKPDLRAKKTKEAARHVLQQMDRCALELNLARAYPYAELLLKLTRKFSVLYDQLLFDAGLIDFDGVLYKTFRLLEENPPIADHYRDQFKLIMVDEFQDTNQIQTAIITRICQQDFSNLCTVGDSQQSIYRFQGADVGVYLTHKDVMASDEVSGITATLADNFRSHGDVLAFVRRICGQQNFFTESFLDLKAGRDERRVIEEDRHFKGDGPRLTMSSISYPGRAVSVSVVRSMEATQIAQWFQTLKEAGHSPSDMVLLLGSTTALPIYMDALQEAGFSCLIEGGSKFYESADVALLNDILWTLANPAQTNTLFSVLGSEIFCLQADDFVELSTDASQDSSTPKRTSLEKKLLGDDPFDSDVLSFARMVLRRAWDRVGHQAPSRIVETLFEEAGLWTRLEEQGLEGRARSANLLKGIRLIRGLEEVYGIGALEVARAFSATFGGPEKLGVLTGTTSDAIRIMTIHGSKGLEFPLVAIAECYDPRLTTNPLVLESVGSCTALSLALPKPPVDFGFTGEKTFLAAQEEPVVIDRSALTPTLAAERKRLILHRQDQEQAERRRLFYVALTRASEAVYLSFRTPEKGNRDELLKKVAQGLFDQDDFPDEAQQLEIEPGVFLSYESSRAIEAEPDEKAGVLEDDIPADQTDNSQLDNNPRTLGIPSLAPETERAVSLAPRKERWLVSYSSLSHEHTQPQTKMPEILSDDGAPETPTDAPKADADKATDFGSAFHRLAEIAISFGPEAACQRLNPMVRRYKIKDVGRLTDALERWLGSDIFKRASAYQHRQAELPFALNLGPVVLEGEIDLFCTNAAGGPALIIDYKTGGSPSETADDLYDKHLLQAQCYGYATLCAGYESVELLFVRVEQIDPDKPTEPQVQRYAFSQDDREELLQAILEVQRG